MTPPQTDRSPVPGATTQGHAAWLGGGITLVVGGIGVLSTSVSMAPPSRSRFWLGGALIVFGALVMGASLVHQFSHRLIWRRRAQAAEVGKELGKALGMFRDVIMMIRHFAPDDHVADRRLTELYRRLDMGASLARQLSHTWWFRRTARANALRGVLGEALATLDSIGRVRLIASYDAETERELMALHRSVEGLLNRLELESDLHYSSLEGEYMNLESDLRVLRVRNELRDHNEQTLEQFESLGGMLRGLRELHRKGPVSREFVRLVRLIYEGAFKAMIKLENAKKRATEGTDSAPHST